MSEKLPNRDFYLKCRGEDPKCLVRRDETPTNIKQRSTTKILTIYAVQVNLI